MKTLKLILILATTGILVQSCTKGGGIWAIQGEGSTITETRTAKDFSSISLNCEGDIQYVQDSVYLVQISAQKNILAVMETKVVENELRISFRREVRRHNEIKIIVHSPYMNGLSINGSGNINAQGTIQTQNIGLYISGSGNIIIPTLNSTYVDSKISGSGNINIKGGVGSRVSFLISGSGSVNSFNSTMVCKDATVKISGSGDVTINATDNLDVNITGSGNVRYKGNPVIRIEDSGSGKLIHVN